MAGLDDWLVGFSDGTTLWLVLAVSVLLGLRHATDPDHVVAVTTLVASGRERAARGAARLGLAWGLGHALTLFAFGLPVLLFARELPERGQQAAETAVAALIVVLALRLLARWRRGELAPRDHPHGGDRTPLAAFGVGLVHGVGGSAGVGVLLVATIDATPVAVAALAILAVFTAVSMTSLTTGFGMTLASRPLRGAIGRLAPVLGVAGLAFGVWYASAAWALTSYPL